MTSGTERFVIVGAGLAGAKAAEALRQEGFDGRLILIGDEPERPYERPPLSKDYLRGETDEGPYVHGESFYPSNDDRALDLHPGDRNRAGPAGAAHRGGPPPGLRPPPDRHRLGAPPPRCARRRARRHPLPAHPRRLGADRRADRAGSASLWWSALAGSAPRSPRPLARRAAT